jgi:hypothetical protein
LNFSGITEVWELAEEFGVTEDVARFRMRLPDVQGAGLGK